MPRVTADIPEKMAHSAPPGRKSKAPASLARGDLSSASVISTFHHATRAVSACGYAKPVQLAMKRLGRRKLPLDVLERWIAKRWWEFFRSGASRASSRSAPPSDPSETTEPGCKQQ